MRSVPKMIAAGAASAALIASSAVAAAPLPQAPATQAPAPNAWMMLSVLGPTRAIALGGANAAAQPADVPPPPPRAGAVGAMSGGAGELIPFALWFGLIVIALTISGPSGRPNSPA